MPEFKLHIEGLVNKEKVLDGLLASGYIVASKKTIGDNYEITIYGRERVDGKAGKKSTDLPWVGTMNLKEED